jgi:uncharacterized membrane protein YhaH (DUF805 family)
MAISQPSTTTAGAVPLSQPYYGAPVGEAVKRFFTKYATFSGRASLSEYWWWILVSYAAYFALGLVAAVVGATGATIAADGTVAPPSAGSIVVGLLIGVFWLATIIPLLALTARRLHDGNFSAWFILIPLVPVIGGIVLIVLTILPAKPEGARFDA